MTAISSQGTSSVLCMIPQGKPSKIVGERPKNYKGMKGDGNCHLYALKIATGFQCEIPKDSLANIKAHRRKITELDDIWWKRQTVINVVKASFQYIGGSFQDKNNILQNISGIFQIIKNEEQKGKFRQGTLKVAADFMLKYQANLSVNLLEFQQSLQKAERISNHSKFLLSEKLPLGERFRNLNEQYKAVSPIDTASQSGQYHVLHNVFTDHLNDLFKMECCDWMPHQSIAELAQVISTKGPVVVGAMLGADHAATPAEVLESWNIDEYAVYGWTEKTYRQKEGVSGHSIVLVGVKNECVIFIDPSVPCGAKEKRKAYAVPYSIFCMKVVSTLGQQMPIEMTASFPQLRYLLSPGKEKM